MNYKKNVITHPISRVMNVNWKSYTRNKIKELLNNSFVFLTINLTEHWNNDMVGKFCRMSSFKIHAELYSYIGQKERGYVTS